MITRDADEPYAPTKGELTASGVHFSIECPPSYTRQDGRSMTGRTTLIPSETPVSDARPSPTTHKRNGGKAFPSHPRHAAGPDC